MFYDDDRRLGKVSVTDDMLRNALDEFTMMMAGAVVLRAEYLYIDNCIEYHLWHPLFPVISVGQVLPTYLGVFTKSLNDDGETHHTEFSGFSVFS
jgi:hypothetical protein